MTCGSAAVGFSTPGSSNVISACGGGGTIWEICFGGEGGGIGDAGGKGGDGTGSSSVFGGVEDGKGSLPLFAGPGVGLRPSRKAFAMSAAFHFA